MVHHLSRRRAKIAALASAPASSQDGRRSRMTDPTNRPHPTRKLNLRSAIAGSVAFSIGAGFMITGQILGGLPFIVLGSLVTAIAVYGLRLGRAVPILNVA